MMHLKIKCIETFFMDFLRKKIIIKFYKSISHSKLNIFTWIFLPSTCLPMCKFGVAIYFTSNIRKCTLNA